MHRCTNTLTCCGITRRVSADKCCHIEDNMCRYHKWKRLKWHLFLLQYKHLSLWTSNLYSKDYWKMDFALLPCKHTLMTKNWKEIRPMLAAFVQVQYSTSKFYELSDLYYSNWDSWENPYIISPKSNPFLWPLDLINISLVQINNSDSNRLLLSRLKQGQ